MSAAVTLNALNEARRRISRHRDKSPAPSIDGCIALDAIHRALSMLLAAHTQIVEAMPPAMECALEGVADALCDIGADVAAYYATPVLSAVDLRNITLDERSKAQRENVA